MTTKSKKLLKGAGAGFLAGVALILVTLAVHAPAPLIMFLMLPAGILHALRLDFLIGSAFKPDVSDDVGMGALFVFSAIAWPVIGAVVGALIAHFANQRTAKPNPHA